MTLQVPKALQWWLYIHPLRAEFLGAKVLLRIERGDYNFESELNPQSIMHDYIVELLKMLRGEISFEFHLDSIEKQAREEVARLEKEQPERCIDLIATQNRILRKVERIRAEMVEGGGAQGQMGPSIQGRNDRGVFVA